jgi:2-haloacid dehalogenase
MKLTDFSALTFDCYGTLIDWESGIVTGLAGLAKRTRVTFSRNQLLEVFAAEESAQEVETPAMPYSQLLSVVYQRIARIWRVSSTSKEADAFGASVPDWPEFPDSAGALHYLKQHYKLVILSNVDRNSFSASNARLRTDFDAIYTAQDIGSYKPDLRNFEFMLRRLKSDFGLEKAAVLLTAQSLFHDHAPANRVGLASAWIDRRHGESGWGATKALADMPRYDFRFKSLAEFVLAHQRELSG